MHLYLVRHTQPQVEAGTCYGQTDLGLAASFEAELAAVKSKLAHLSNAKVYSSPLKRCSELAQHFSHLGEVQFEPRIMELNFGDWEMKKWDDVPSGLIEEWAEDHIKQAPPNGESFESLSQRCLSFLEEVSTHAECENILVFTHAGAIRALLSHILGLPLQNAFRLHVDYGGVSQVKLDRAVNCLVGLNR